MAPGPRTSSFVKRLFDTLTGRNTYRYIAAITPLASNFNFLSTHRTFVFLLVSDSSIGQLSENICIHGGTPSSGCPKKNGRELVPSHRAAAAALCGWPFAHFVLVSLVYL